MSRLVRTLLATAALIAVVVLAILWIRELTSSERPVRIAIRQQLQRGRLPRALGPDDSTAAQVARFYRARQYRPAWLFAGAPNHQAHELLDVLENAVAEGLDPADYRVERIRGGFDSLAKLVPIPPSGQARALANLDVLLTHGWLHYASDLYDGRVRPRTLGLDWYTRPRRTDYVAALVAAVREGRARAVLDTLPPRHPQYRRLRDALHRYSEIVERGGWRAIPPGTTLRRGSRGRAVELLRRRLMLSGDLGKSAATRPLFDRTLEDAVRSFQRRHGLEPTGQVGAAERAALNVPAADRWRQIALNMERWRWMPARLGSRYGMVNIPDFTLRVVERNRAALEMRVVVGTDTNQTPVFIDTLTYMVLNPVWNVPDQIAVKEIVAHVRENSSYLAENQIRLYDGPGNDAREIDPGSIDWNRIDESNFHWSFRQDPGEKNALGHVKFMCPNRFNVYLHSTPAVELFARPERAFSHGCIRLEKPVELGVYLMREKPGWDRARFEAEFETAHNQSVRLPEPLPIHILYWTAWADDGGVVQFRRDVYGIDRELAAALARRGAGPRRTLTQRGANSRPALTQRGANTAGRPRSVLRALTPAGPLASISEPSRPPQTRGSPWSPSRDRRARRHRSALRRARSPCCRTLLRSRESRARSAPR